MVAELKDTLPDDVAQMVERLHVGGLQKPENDRCIALIERLAHERDGWIDSAKYFSNGMEYYRGLIDEAAKHIGIDMYTADDQGVHPEPLRAKLPECVEHLSAERESYKAMLKEQWAAGVPPDCVVVPKEPTEAIRKAGCVYLDDDLFIADGIYKAMIAAGEVKP